MLAVWMAALPGCSRAEPGPGAEAAEPSTALPDRQFLVRAVVLQLDAAALELDEGKRLLATATEVDGAASADQLAQIRRDQAVLLAAGTARVVSSPAMMLLEGQPAEVGVSSSAPAGANAPKRTRSDTLKVECSLTTAGLVSGRYTLLAAQEVGEIEHAAAEFGIPLGDRALIRIEAATASGATVVGVCTLSPSNDLGGAFVLFVEPSLIVPTDEPP